VRGEFKQERVPVFRDEPLRLAFSPNAIRQHFAGNELVAGLSDEELLEIGWEALEDDETLESFHSVLVRAVCRLHEGIDECDLE
jgi:hypothetical protein